MKSAQILIIEDEKDIRDLISFQLKSEGYQVTISESADKAISIIEDGQNIDLFIVDWMLPGHLSGLEFTKRIKSIPQYKDIPVVMITALTQPENIVAGLDAGADDYITKPFDLNVLQARVRVQLRSRLEVKSSALSDLIDYGSLKIEKTKCRVTTNSNEINLTSTEYKILLLLAEKPGHVFTRDQLIGQIQGENIYVTGRTIDTHIAGLRKKMGETSNMIETIRGIGYRFKDV